MSQLAKLITVLAIATTAIGCDRPKSQPPARDSSHPQVVLTPSPAAGSEQTPPAQALEKTSSAMNQFAESSNRFGFDLYKKLVTKEKGNFIISPASITTALAMTWGGAQGATASEMQQTLHFDSTPSQVMEASGKLVALLTEASRPITFRIANQLFGEQTYAFESPYLAQMKQAYGASLQQMDFISAPEPARQTINAWVENQTEKRIKDLIPTSGIDSETRLVLVNAIYFLGDWARPFDKERTHPSPFHLSSKETKTVPTMNRSGTYRIAADNGITALELPYQGEDMSMIVLLPDSIDGLDAMEASMTDTSWQRIMQGLNQAQVWVSMPKFTIEPTVSLRLREPLVDMGMRTAFLRGSADFTGIANPPEKTERLFISEVFHKGFIRVDEKGTEAAAATAVTMARTASAMMNLREFKADHPFGFVIRDNATGIILFMGRVTDPSK